jgi:hypothetical protein
MECVHDNHILQSDMEEYQNIDGNEKLDSDSKRSKTLDKLLRKDASNARGNQQALVHWDW